MKNSLHSLQRKGPKSQMTGFSFDTTMEDLESFKEGHCPSNTVKNNEWALRTF